MKRALMSLALLGMFLLSVLPGHAEQGNDVRLLVVLTEGNTSTYYRCQPFDGVIERGDGTPQVDASLRIEDDPAVHFSCGYAGMLRRTDRKTGLRR